MITFSNGEPAKMGLGRYQLRNNRIAEITGSHFETWRVNGVEYSKKVWEGTLFNADGKTKESAQTWSDLGGYTHESDGQSGFDVTTVISQPAEPVAQSAPPAVLENQILCTALVDLLQALFEPADGPTVGTLKRVLAERESAIQQVKEMLVAAAGPSA